MKIRFKITFSKIAILIVAIYLVILLAASNRVAYSQSTDIKQAENCLIDRLLNRKCTVPPKPIILPTPSPTPVPTQPLTAKERFIAALTKKFTTIPQPNSYEFILLRAYGAPFVNLQSTIKLPKQIVFTNDKETKEFQDTITKGKVAGTRNCYLQKSAADALNKAHSQARFRLKSGYAASDCIRNYATTARFWRKYTNSRTLDLVKKGKETRILGTVAPPGASQHLWGLAIDLRVRNKKQIAALNQNGWYRTVEFDVPHWSYVGYPPQKLIELGFHKKIVKGVTYWVTPL